MNMPKTHIQTLSFITVSVFDLREKNLIENHLIIDDVAKAEGIFSDLVRKHHPAIDTEELEGSLDDGFYEIPDQLLIILNWPDVIV